MTIKGAAGMLAGAIVIFTAAPTLAFPPTNKCERDFFKGCVTEHPVQPGDCDSIEPGVKTIKSHLTDKQRCERGMMPRFGARGERVMACYNGGKWVCEQ